MSNATLDKDTLTKAPGMARILISKTTSTFAGMALGSRASRRLPKVCYVCDAERVDIPAGTDYSCHTKLNGKGIPDGNL